MNIKITCRAIFGIVAVLACSACASKPESHSLLVAELSGVIHKGIPGNEARRKLQGIDFYCYPQKIIDKELLLECTRTRARLLPPTSCTHRVQYRYALPEGPLDDLLILNPVCTWL